ncbi:hypothetical protein L4X63_21995 [Geomonas sp. Red32]|uniref:hypothetical protein n=1 Tax=Geomonas sp. Red32 TaxID=2912856 RepID=UPI00202CDDE4|nr:hypothetical protein [Geomonas sp. Red32]MCM0084260.1 hypothetical protein [Geomonas sp. Red32]
MAVTAITAAGGMPKISAISSATSRKRSVTTKPATIGSDLVEISTTARVKSMQLSGLSARQISIELGLDLATVEFYLGLAPAKAGATTWQTATARAA